jgi:hypothetical protein
MDKNTIFLILWGLLSLIVLTASATKRAIYLTPVLPAYAIMAAVSLPRTRSVWFRSYGYFWMILCVLLIALVTFCPLFSQFLPHKIPPKMLDGLSHFNLYHALSFLGLAASILLLTRYRNTLKIESMIVIVTGILYISLFGAPMKAIDTDKSMQSDIKHFAAGIPDHEKTQLAAYDLSETFRGCLYYYSGLRVHQITDIQRVSTILQGKDDEYDSLLFSRTMKTGNEDNTLAREPYKITHKIITGTDHILYLITGDRDQTALSEIY